MHSNTVHHCCGGRYAATLTNLDTLMQRGPSVPRIREQVFDPFNSAHSSYSCLQPLCPGARPMQPPYQPLPLRKAQVSIILWRYNTLQTNLQLAVAIV
jgi:hypothetical protein